MVQEKIYLLVSCQQDHIFVIAHAISSTIWFLVDKCLYSRQMIDERDLELCLNSILIVMMNLIPLIRWSQFLFNSHKIDAAINQFHCNCLVAWWFDRWMRSKVMFELCIYNDAFDPMDEVEDVETRVFVCHKPACDLQQKQ